MAVHTPAIQQSSRPRRIAQAILMHRRLWLIAAALAAVLTLPSLRVGLIADDYHARLLMRGSDSPIRILKSPLDMFRLISGDPGENAALRDLGFLPWWADDHVKAAFWRPIASLTHWVDYVLWPDTPALMHAHSILWYALLAAAAALLYRRVMGITTAAGLAALLYAADRAHGVPVSFLANRNALIAALFGVLCLLAHLRWRQGGWRPGAVLAPVLLALSLLAKEEGIATCAYLAAFAIVLEEAPWRMRTLSMLPYVVVMIAWRWCWSHLDYGVSSIGPYVDPLAEPLRYLATLAYNAPVLLLGQMGLPPADASVILEDTHEQWFCIGAWLFALLLAAVLCPLLKRDRITRFWALGMLLALLPAGTTLPADRMLLFIGLGGIGLVAQLLAWWWMAGEERLGGWLWRAPAAAMVGLFILVHVIVSPVDLSLRAAAPMGPRAFVERLYPHEPLDSAVARQDLVLVNPPASLLVMASALQWADADAPMPRHMRVLCSSLFRPVEVRRTDEHTLVVRPRPSYLFWKMDRLWRSDQHPMRVGQQVRLAGMTATVLALNERGRPTEVAFRFDVPLEDPSLRWLQWRDGGFLPFRPPPAGESATLQARLRDAFP